MTTELHSSLLPSIEGNSSVGRSKQLADCPPEKHLSAVLETDTGNQNVPITSQSGNLLTPFTLPAIEHPTSSASTDQVFPLESFVPTSHGAEISMDDDFLKEIATWNDSSNQSLPPLAITCPSVAADTTTNTTTYSALQPVKTSYNFLPSVPSFDVLNTLPRGANLSHINRGLGTPLFPTQPPSVHTKWTLKCNIKYSFIGSLESTSHFEWTWSCCGRSAVNFELTSVDAESRRPNRCRAFDTSPFVNAEVESGYASRFLFQTRSVQSTSLETSSIPCWCLLRRWLREYLLTLQKRHKWFSFCRDLKEDDLVLIVDENIPRGQWRSGRVVLVHKAKDGHVRSAVIKTRSSHLTRPISKLFIVRMSIEFCRLYVTNFLVFVPK